jgi:hypothetical protein
MNKSNKKNGTLVNKCGGIVVETIKLPSQLVFILFC